MMHPKVSQVSSQILRSCQRTTYRMKQKNMLRIRMSFTPIMKIKMMTLYGIKRPGTSHQQNLMNFWISKL